MDTNDTQIPQEQPEVPTEPTGEVTEGKKKKKERSTPYYNRFGKRHGNALKPKQVKFRLQAKTLFDIFRETGKLNLSEGVRRCYPNQKNPDEYVEHLGRPEVMEEFCKLVRIDEKAISSLKCEDILKDLMEDVKRLNMLLDSGAITTEEMIKVINAKGSTNKLLGMFLGMWKQDKPQAADEESADEVWKQFSGRLEGLNSREN